MRWLRTLGALAALLVGVTLAAAWLVPPRLDLNSYREDIAQLAADRLGRAVRIDGPITLRLLPEPILTAANVSVGAGDSIRVTASELLLRVAPVPLLRGRIDARELVLRGADLHLPWPLDPDTLMVRTPAWLTALSARVEEGKLSVGDLNFTHIDATLTTEAYTGTYAAAGTAEMSGHSWHFTARLTQPGSDGSAGLDVTLDGQGKMQGTGAKLSGQIGPDGTLAGRVSGSGPDLSLVLPAPAVAFRAEGRVTIAGGLAAADDLAMEIGGSPARGAIAVRVSPSPRLDLALATSRLDLDAWLPVLVRATPLQLPTGIDLSAEAATYAGGTLRGLRAAVDLSRSRAEVREARAMLPGDAPLRLSGQITLADGVGPPHPRFEGDVSVTAPALRTTLAWLDHAGVSPFASLPEGVLRTADLSGHVVAEAAQVAVGSLSGMVDDSHVDGSLTLRGGKRFAIGAGLAVDRLDLDPWLPATPPTLASLPTRFAPFDVDLRMEAKTALLHGITIAPLSLDAAAEAGKLTVRKLDMSVNGVHASASATVGADGQVSEGLLDLQAPTAQPLAALLPDSLAVLGHRAPRLWRAAANVQVLGAGMPNKLGLKVTADLGDLHLEAQPTLDLTNATWTATMMLRHPGAPRLAEALGVTNAASWLGDGSLSVIAQLSGATAKLAADSFELSAGSLHATGALLLERDAGMPSLTGHVNAEALPLPLPYPRALDPLPTEVLAGWEASVKLDAGHVLLGQLPVMEKASANVALAKGVLRIDGLTARVAGGRLDGLAILDAQAQPPNLAANLTITGANVSAPLFELPLDVVSGTLDLGLAMSATGHSPAALLSTLAGEAHMQVRDGVLSGVAMAKASDGLTPEDVEAALRGGATPFSALDVQVQADKGILTLRQASLTAPSGTASVTGSLDLPGAAADLRLAIRPAVPDAPEIGLRLTGPLDALRRTPELAEVMRWRTARAVPPAPADPTGSP